MSVKMVDHIVDEHHIDIDSGMIKRVKVCLYGYILPTILYFFLWFNGCHSYIGY